MGAYKNRSYFFNGRKKQFSKISQGFKVSDGARNHKSLCCGTIRFNITDDLSNTMLIDVKLFEMLAKTSKTS
jgi:hypothetical protein